MQIYGREVDFKVSRLKDAGNLEMALDNLERSEERIKKSGVTSIRKMYEELIKMFRTFFVEATGTDVLADCEDAEDAKDAYFDFLKEVEKQKFAVGVSLTDIK